MTRRDLKLVPPADMPTAARGKWLNAKPMEVETEIDNKKSR